MRPFLIPDFVSKDNFSRELEKYASVAGKCYCPFDR